MDDEAFLRSEVAELSQIARKYTGTVLALLSGMIGAFVILTYLLRRLKKFLEGSDLVYYERLATKLVQDLMIIGMIHIGVVLPKSSIQSGLSEKSDVFWILQFVMLTLLVLAVFKLAHAFLLLAMCEFNSLFIKSQATPEMQRRTYAEFKMRFQSSNSILKLILIWRRLVLKERLQRLDIQKVFASELNLTTGFNFGSYLQASMMKICQELFDISPLFWPMMILCFNGGISALNVDPQNIEISPTQGLRLFIGIFGWVPTVFHFFLLLVLQMQYARFIRRVKMNLENLEIDFDDGNTPIRMSDFHILNSKSTTTHLLKTLFVFQIYYLSVLISGCIYYVTLFYSSSTVGLVVALAILPSFAFIFVIAPRTLYLYSVLASCGDEADPTVIGKFYLGSPFSETPRSRGTSPRRHSRLPPFEGIHLEPSHRSSLPLNMESVVSRTGVAATTPETRSDFSSAGVQLVKTDSLRLETSGGLMKTDSMRSDGKSTKVESGGGLRKTDSLRFASEGFRKSDSLQLLKPSLLRSDEKQTLSSSPQRLLSQSGSPAKADADQPRFLGDITRVSSDSSNRGVESITRESVGLTFVRAKSSSYSSELHDSRNSDSNTEKGSKTTIPTAQAVAPPAQNSSAESTGSGPTTQVRTGRSRTASLPPLYVAAARDRPDGGPSVSGDKGAVEESKKESVTQNRMSLTMLPPSIGFGSSAFQEDSVARRFSLSIDVEPPQLEISEKRSAKLTESPSNIIPETDLFVRSPTSDSNLSPPRPTSLFDEKQNDTVSSSSSQAAPAFPSQIQRPHQVTRRRHSSVGVPPQSQPKPESQDIPSPESGRRKESLTESMPSVSPILMPQIAPSSLLVDLDNSLRDLQHPSPQRRTSLLQMLQTQRMAEMTSPRKDSGEGSSPHSNSSLKGTAPSSPKPQLRVDIPNRFSREIIPPNSLSESEGDPSPQLRTAPTSPGTQSSRGYQSPKTPSSRGYQSPGRLSIGKQSPAHSPLRLSPTQGSPIGGGPSSQLPPRPSSKGRMMSPGRSPHTKLPVSQRLWENLERFPPPSPVIAQVDLTPKSIFAESLAISVEKAMEPKPRTSSTPSPEVFR